MIFIILQITIGHAAGKVRKSFFFHNQKGYDNVWLCDIYVYQMEA